MLHTVDFYCIAWYCILLHCYIVDFMTLYFMQLYSIPSYLRASLCLSIVFIFLVSYVGEGPRWPIQIPNRGRQKMHRIDLCHLICDVPFRRITTQSVNSLSGLLRAADAREASYTYINNLKYKSAKYSGMWMYGLPHGRCVKQYTI